MSKYGNIIIGIIAIIALFIGISATRQTKFSSVADRVISNGEIRIGYIVYPPLLYKDTESGQLSGVSYDIVSKPVS